MVCERECEDVNEYLVEMEIGICSCHTGSTGAACKHQAAVAKLYKLATVNVAPVHSVETRHLFATIALGDAQNLQFYADLTEYVPPIITSTNNVKQPENPTDTSTNNELSETDSSYDDSTNDPWMEHVKTYKESLYDIVDDLSERLIEGDHNLLSGVGKFIKHYQQMTKSHAPNAALAYALHNF